MKNEELQQISGELESAEVVKKHDVLDKEAVVNFEFSRLLEFGSYVLGFILIVLSVIKYCGDLPTYKDEFHFDEVRYVGGDAYNYIISAARSSAVLIKSLIMAIWGCFSIVVGLLIKISTKK